MAFGCDLGLKIIHRGGRSARAICSCRLLLSATTTRAGEDAQQFNAYESRYICGSIQEVKKPNIEGLFSNARRVRKCVSSGVLYAALCTLLVPDTPVQQPYRITASMRCARM
jgi:hypothetical protein